MEKFFCRIRAIVLIHLSILIERIYCMTEPVTKLDQYSAPKAEATPWEETRRVLETAELFSLVTVGADGRPHATPLVAVWHEGALYFNTADTEQKAIHLRGNPHVLLITGSFHWNEGLDVVVDGDAVQVTDESLLKRLVEVWRTKWDGRWRYEMDDGAFYPGALVFEARPARVYVSSQGDPFGHTRYQFERN
jgi:nitroimidazol reductase NimA-like FMN-containing flavoprotein (pyridoxamine 5'-phosphate oxidase superfamily)